jgi:3-oxo-5-alpha-steroid 4-dehydrogenase 1
MSVDAFFDVLVIGWLTVAAVTAAALFFVAAPYGRHARSGWGPTIENRLGWIVMEAPAALVFGAWFAFGRWADTTTALVFFGLWEVHYVHRAFIYPLGLRGRDKRMPVAVAGMAFLFNAVNGYLNGCYLFDFSGGYPNEWLGDPRFVAGLGLFLTGFMVNRQADHTLRHLREPGEGGYRIPYGGLYRWVSCPNYLGEIVEWTGWAVATWSLAGLAFAAWTAANLAPRAWTHHAWYRAHFADYPPERRALLPGLW